MNVVEISVGMFVNIIGRVVSQIVAMYLINTFHFARVLPIFGYPYKASRLLYPSNSSYTITSVFTAIRGTDISREF